MDNKAECSVVFFLVPDFSMIAFATAIEPMRIANRMLGNEYYRWRLASLDGNSVCASNGIEVSVTRDLKQERQALTTSKRPSITFLCSGMDVEKVENKSLYAYLRENKNSGVTVAGLCTGAYLLAAAGLLN